jgi:hypothetical protein
VRGPSLVAQLLHLPMTLSWVAVHFFSFFCRQYFPDSTIPERAGDTGRCGFLFYARSRALILIISAGCTGTPLRKIKSWTNYLMAQDLILGMDGGPYLQEGVESRSPVNL